MSTNGGMGALDFAGGTVVHISSGISALAAGFNALAIMEQKKRGVPITDQRRHRRDRSTPAGYWICSAAGVVRPGYTNNSEISSGSMMVLPEAPST